MIRQLHRLLRPVPALGPDALALAVYAHPSGDANAEFTPQLAAEQGFEGVACVDDAARAAILYLRVWQCHGFGWARTTAEGLLAFVCAMQLPDGAFVNFIGDWEGRRQVDSPTSNSRGGPWHPRAMHALACAVATLGDMRYIEAFERGLAALGRDTPYLDMRAVSALAALEYWRGTGDDRLAARAVSWAETIAAARVGDVLADIEGRETIHLWGHLQEAALAQIGAAFGRDDLVRLAARSADAVLVPPVERAFAGARTLAFDVSSTIAGLDAVAAATGSARHADLADRARAWFDGRNAAGGPVYDRERGLVLDGIDGDIPSRNSGAESNIEGGLALIGSPRWDVDRCRPPQSLSLARGHE